MVWPFWSSNGGQDPLSKLDPELRKALEKEAPARYEVEQPAPIPKSSSNEPSSQQPPQSKVAQDPDEKPRPPSLFSDGRYDYLWKTYRPEGAGSSGKSSQEKLNDIIAVHRKQNASVGDAALENCALEALAQAECFKNPGFKDKLTMCRSQTKALDRCYEMNMRFLKALGYVGFQGRSQEQEDNIQMHADSLYRKMLQREKLEKEAKEQGKPVPPFEPLLEEIPKDKRLDLDAIDPKKREELEGRLNNLQQGSIERDMEERAILRETELSREAFGYLQKMKEGSKKE